MTRTARCTGRPATRLSEAYASYDPAATERAPAVVTILGTSMTRPHWRTAESEARAIARTLGYDAVRDRRCYASRVDGLIQLSWQFTLNAEDVRPGVQIDSDGHPYSLTTLRGMAWITREGNRA